MSKEKRRVPKLRFPGFTEDWEQRKLGDYLIQYTEITTQNNQYPVLTSSRKGLFFQTDYYDGNQIASKNNTGYNIVPYGYFTYRHMSDDDIFHFNINYIVDKGIVSTLYPVFTTKNLNSNYLQLQLNYGTEFREYAVLLKQGGSRTYMYFNKLKDLKLTVSTSIDEQEIIAKFFISFEKLITLHQRKLDNLKLKKKALLQKLFPKNGERYPELRFPGFTDAWEQRKFSDLYEKISEKNDLSYSLDKIISVANMYYKSDAKVSNEEYLKTYNIFRYGEIAFEGNKSKDFAYGRFVENTIGDGIISHVFEVFRPIVKYDIYFWKYYINYEPIMGKVLSRCTKKTTMMTNLVAKDFLKETVLVPTLAEQKQIGTLLNTLDKFITLHQRKLDHLKLQKKALLQQMFV